MTRARLTTLGTIDLRNPAGDEAGSVLRQPRRFALLVYLALESRRGFVRRDRVIGVFWPESSQEAGRRNLSQTLHWIRRALGEDAVQNRGADDLQLDFARVHVDACDFLDAAESGRHEEALALSAGEFLPAFYVNGAPEFDQWLDSARGMLRRAAAQSGWAAAEAAAERGEWVAAGSHARRAAALCGEDESAVRRLMGFLASIGDRAGALDAYEAFARVLAREYGAEPAAATVELSEQIREGSYATSLPHAPSPVALPVAAPSPEAVAAVSVGASAAEVAEAASPEVSEGWRRSIRGRLLQARSLAVSGVLMAAFISLWGLTRRDEGLPELNARLVVEETTGAELSDALSASILHQLSSARPLDVVVEGQESAGARDGVLDYGLRSTVMRGAKGLEVSAALVERETGRVVKTYTTDEPNPATTEAVQLVAMRIASFARKAMGEELERKQAVLAGVKPAALRGLLRARDAILASDSLTEYGMATVARIRLASADSELSAMEEMEPKWQILPLTRAELSYVAMSAFMSGTDADMKRARAAMLEGMRHADRALRLDPSNARALELRGVLRHWRWSTTPQDSVTLMAGELKLAESDLERATKASEGAALAWNALADIRLHNGEFSAAYSAARNALEADTYMEHARGIRMLLFHLALELGDMRDAQRWAGVVHETDTDSWLDAYAQLTLLAWQPSADGEAVERATALRASALAAPGGAAVAPVVDGAYGVVLAKAGRRLEARSVADSLLLRGKADAESLPPAAWILSTLGDRNARAVLGRYISGWPPARAWLEKSSRYTTVQHAS